MIEPRDFLLRSHSAIVFSDRPNPCIRFLLACSILRIGMKRVVTKYFNTNITEFLVLMNRRAQAYKTNCLSTHYKVSKINSQFKFNRTTVMSSDQQEFNAAHSPFQVSLVNHRIVVGVDFLHGQASASWRLFSG